MASSGTTYRDILAACVDWGFTADAQFVIREFHVFGKDYPPGDPTGTSLASFVGYDGEAEPGARRLLRMLRDGSDVRHFDYHKSDGAGDYYYYRLDAVPLLADDGSVLGCVGGVRHVGEVVYREMEVALRRIQLDKQLIDSSSVDAERRLRDFAAAGTDWFWELDADLKFTYLSENAEVLSRYPRELIYGLSRREILGDSYDHRHWEGHLAELDAHKAFTAFEYRLPEDRDGNPRWLRISGVPVFDDAGVFKGYRGVGSDVTALYEARERALRAEQQAAAEAARAESERERVELQRQLLGAEKLKVVGQLSGGIAHDFNNLLSVVLGSSELLRVQLSGHERQVALIDQILAAATRAGDLTRRLLAFSRQQSLKPQVIRLEALLEGMHALLARTLGEAIEIAVKVERGLWSCHADPGELESALMNLAINARDAMPGGGQLSLSLSNRRVDDVMSRQMQELAAGDYVVLEVSDTGHGIAQEVLPRVLEPFFTTKEQSKGSGLGLSVIYGFAKQSGGTVTIYSVEGKGTTVRVYLPRGQGESPSEAPSAPEAPGHGNGERVLLVEDEDSVRELVVELLEGLGYTPLQAENGPGALSLVESGAEVDLVLTDLVLGGGIDGPEVVARILGQRPGLPVVYMSGYAGPHRGALVDPNIELLAKPFGMEALARALHNALQRPR